MSATVDAADLKNLALFPLPGVVLFPGAVMPLHIFETRYRQMTTDVLDGSGLIALARLRPEHSSDDHGRPAIYPVAGVGTVLAADKTDDGRFYLLVRGLARVLIADERPPEKAYRIAHATLLDDVKTDRPGSLTLGQHQLVALCDRLAASVAEQGDELRRLARHADTPGECADLVSAALMPDPKQRQHMLETLDPADRLDQINDYVAEVIAKIGGEQGMLN